VSAYAAAPPVCTSRSAHAPCACLVFREQEEKNLAKTTRRRRPHRRQMKGEVSAYAAAPPVCTSRSAHAPCACLVFREQEEKNLAKTTRRRRPHRRQLKMGLKRGGRAVVRAWDQSCCFCHVKDALETPDARYLHVRQQKELIRLVRTPEFRFLLISHKKNGMLLALRTCA
jgi:hypothetical protein